MNPKAVLEALNRAVRPDSEELSTTSVKDALSFRDYLVDQEDLQLPPIKAESVRGAYFCSDGFTHLTFVLSVESGHTQIDVIESVSP